VCAQLAHPLAARITSKPTTLHHLACLLPAQVTPDTCRVAARFLFLPCSSHSLPASCAPAVPPPAWASRQAWRDPWCARPWR
jgi:hypothetical protein